MKYKRFFLSLFPAFLFLLAFFYLTRLHINVNYTINMQSEYVKTFISTTSKEGVVVGLKGVIVEFFNDFLLPLSPAFVTVSIALIFISLHEGFSKRYFIVSWLAFTPLVLFVSRSVILLCFYIACLVSVVTVRKVEPKLLNLIRETTSKLRVINVFIALGVFLAMVLNFSIYRKTIEETTVDLMLSFVPNAQDLVEAQTEQLKSFVNQTGEGFKGSISTEFASLPQDVRVTCRPVYDAVIMGIDSYTKEFMSEMEKRKHEVGEEKVRELLVSSIPAFEGMIKSMPLTLAVVVFSILEIIKIIFSAIGVLLVYSTYKILTIKRKL